MYLLKHLLAYFKMRRIVKASAIKIKILGACTKLAGHLSACATRITHCLSFAATIRATIAHVAWTKTLIKIKAAPLAKITGYMIKMENANYARCTWTAQLVNAATADPSTAKLENAAKVNATWHHEPYKCQTTNTLR